METPFGTTRSRVTSRYALLAEDSHVAATVPGWDDAMVIQLISPRMGAEFSQYFVDTTPETACHGALPGIERFVWVVSGSIRVEGVSSQKLGAGHFAFLPAAARAKLRTVDPGRLLVIDKPYQPLRGTKSPISLVGNSDDVEGEAFLGDPDAVLKTLLPNDPSFDLAVNVFTYQAGATLPFVEVHVMEHGLLMLEGQGIYRLDDDWHPVKAGDTIWMAPYCPQWFVAMGKTPASYLYYKDVNREPLTEP